MYKTIYTLKLTLLLHQFPNIPWYRKKKLEKMSFFIIFVYLQSWFTSFLLYNTASSALNLYKRLEKYAKIHKKLSTVGAIVLQRHTWYFSKELITFSLFVSNLPDERTDSIVQKITRRPYADLPVEKLTLPRIARQHQWSQTELLSWTSFTSTVQTPRCTTFHPLPPWLATSIWNHPSERGSAESVNH